MDKIIEQKLNGKKVSVSDIKFYIYIATTAIGIVIFFNNTFATNTRVMALEKEVTGNKEVLCKIAVAVEANVIDTCARYK